MKKIKRSIKYNKRAFLLIWTVFFVFSMIYIVIGEKNNIPGIAEADIQITLNGGGEQVIEYGDHYIELGATAFYNDKNVSHLITVDSNNVDLTKPGKYTVTYTVKLDDKTKSADRTINIVDTKAPVMALKGNNELSLALGSAYNEPGLTAIDNYDGDISDKVIILGTVNTNRAGTYRIKYIVEDSSGNIAATTRKVTIAKTDVKNGVTQLSLTKMGTVYLEYPENYIEPGYYAQDTIDGDITPNIAVKGIVNVKRLGTYTLTYSVTNSTGNTASTTRTVIVQDTQKPVITLTGDAYVTLLLGEEYIDIGYTAWDNYDGDITYKIEATNSIDTNILGRQYVTYTVSDSSGNTTAIERTVEVKNIEKPAITIESGKETAIVERVSSYDIMDGVIAVSSYDGDITNRIVYTSSPNFNINKAGIYTITYNVKDSSNNTAEPISKTVTVQDTIPPVLGVSYSTTEPTTASVTVTITADEDILIDDNTWMVTGNSATKIYNANITNESVTVKDLSTNAAVATININTINTGGNVGGNGNTGGGSAKPLGTVAYNPSTLTNTNVTVTLTTDKAIRDISGWTKVNDKELNKVYSLNQTEVITIEDFSGNTNTVTVNVANIDKEPPTAQVSYSTTEPTGQEVVVTLTLSKEVRDIEGWSTNDYIIFTKAYSDNVTDEIVSFTDLAGNTNSTVIDIANISTGPLTADVAYIPDLSTPTNGDVTVTITANRAITSLTGGYVASGDACTKVYSENIAETVAIEDLFGNIEYIAVNVTNIDKVKPTAVISYSQTGLTKNDVTVTLTFTKQVREIPGWYTEDYIIFTKTYTDNVTDETVYFIDLIGNDNSITFNIVNIDKTPLSCVLDYSPDVATSGDVLVTITANRPISADDWSAAGYTCTKIYMNNATETVIVTDILGHTQEIEVVINWIDKTPPYVVSTTHAPPSPTNGNVLVQLVFSKPIEMPEGWTKIDETTFTKVYENNVTEEAVGFVDFVGNQGSTLITVSNIDRTGPIGSVSYSTTLPTKNPVTVTITTAKAVQNIPGWITTNNTVFTKVYSDKSINETVDFTDFVGNAGSVIVNVDNIDTLPLEASVSYSTTQPTNQNVLVTITANKKILDMPDWTKVSDNTWTRAFEANYYTNAFKIEDAVGNSKNLTIRIDNIDKVAPVVGGIEYLPSTLTRGDVEVYVWFDKEAIMPSDWEWWYYTDFGKIYTNNTTETVYYTDPYGNTGSFDIMINWIDRTPIAYTVEYLPSTLTNKDVKVTVTSTNKDISQTTGGWTRVDNRSVTRTFTANTTTTAGLYDNLGNYTSVPIKIDWINKSSPSLSGVSYYSKNISQLQSINMLSGVTARDNIDGSDITNKITWTSEPEFNNAVAGTYKITFKVANLLGTVATASMTVVVQPSTTVGSSLAYLPAPIPTVGGNVSEVRDEAPVPSGFYYVGGIGHGGTLISDNPADAGKGDSHTAAGTLLGNQFVWVPVNYIGARVTLNPSHFSGVATVKWMPGYADMSHIANYGTAYTGPFDVMGETYVTVYVKANDGTESRHTVYLNGVDFRWHYSDGDDTASEEFKAFSESVQKYGGFYMARYEASYGSGTNAVDYMPLSKRSTIATTGAWTNTPGRLWNHVSYENALAACHNMYSGSSSVVSHLPYGK